MARYNVTYATTMVLQTLADGPRHGFEIADVAGLQTGTVYPALRRLEGLGFVRPTWENVKIARAERRPVRRYYQITDAGRVALEEAQARFARAARLLRTAGHA